MSRFYDTSNKNLYFFQAENIIPTENVSIVMKILNSSRTVFFITMQILVKLRTSFHEFL